MKEILYSVIIPHYNIPKLLERCLDSIPQRPDVQIIIVDDNSSPEIVDFSHFPGMERENVEIIYNKNGGSAGRARNMGLNLAKGKWLLFADADDFYTPNAFSCFDEYVESMNDIVFFETKSVDSVTLQPSYRLKIYNALLHNCDNVSGNTIDMVRCGHSIPVAKMIKRKLVEDFKIRFDESRYANDVIFSLLTGIKAKHVYVDHRIVYSVTTRSGSLIMQITRQSLLARLEVTLRANKLMRENNLSMYQNSLLQYFSLAYKIGLKVLLESVWKAIKYNGININTIWLSPIRIRKLLKNTNCV